MRSLTGIAVLTALLAASGTAAAADVKVTFVHPETFADVPFMGSERDQILAQLKDHIEKLAKSLPADQALNIDVLDVDLAGRVEPRVMGANNIRVMRGSADWPRMTLHFSLEAQGKVVQSGDAELSDMAYLDHLHHNSLDEPLSAEKKMIGDWFKKKFGVKAVG